MTDVPALPSVKVSQRASNACSECSRRVRVVSPRRGGVLAGRCLNDARWRGTGSCGVTSTDNRSRSTPCRLHDKLALRALFLSSAPAENEMVRRRSPLRAYRLPTDCILATATKRCRVDNAPGEEKRTSVTGSRMSDRKTQECTSARLAQPSLGRGGTYFEYLRDLLTTHPQTTPVALIFSSPSLIFPANPSPTRSLVRGEPFRPAPRLTRLLSHGGS